MPFYKNSNDLAHGLTKQSQATHYHSIPKPT